jgi:hypothetical protein
VFVGWRISPVDDGEVQFVQFDETFYGGGRSVEVNVLPSALLSDWVGAVCDGFSNVVLKGVCGFFGGGLEVVLPMRSCILEWYS